MDDASVVRALYEDHREGYEEHTENAEHPQTNIHAHKGNKGWEPDVLADYLGLYYLADDRYEGVDYKQPNTELVVAEYQVNDRPRNEYGAGTKHGENIHYGCDGGDYVEIIHAEYRQRHSQLKEGYEHDEQVSSHHSAHGLGKSDVEHARRLGFAFRNDPQGEIAEPVRFAGCEVGGDSGDYDAYEY